VPVTCNALLYFIIVLCYYVILCMCTYLLIVDEVSSVSLCQILFVVVDCSVLLYCVSAATWCLMWGFAVCVVHVESFLVYFVYMILF
jgi:hypothetical protein